MPVKFTTISEESLARIEEICDAKNCGDEEFAAEIASLFTQFKMYQENRLKINKDSRESKMAARKEGGGGEGRSKSAKMTGVVRLVAIEGQENTFKVEKVSVPVAPKPVQVQEEEEEENLAENPEALAAAVAEAAARAAAVVPKTKHIPKPRGPAIGAASRARDAKEAAKKEKESQPKKIVPKKLKVVAPVAPAEACDSDATLTDVEECD
jgi:hypothetical protein